MKVLAATILIFASICGFSQSLFHEILEEADNRPLIISAHADVFYQGQGLPNKFINKFLYGGHIDNDLKDEVENQLKTEDNRFGVGFRTGVKIYDLSDSLFKNGNWGFAVALEHQQLLTSSFSKDLFHAAFVGNADRIGQDLNMGPSYFNSIQFQTLEFNFVHKQKQCEFGLAIVKGQSHMELAADKMKLNTAGDLSEITLITDLSFFRSDSSNARLSAFNGIGAALNLVYFIPITTSGSRASLEGAEKGDVKSTLGKLKLEIDNFGLVSWMTTPTSYDLDTTFSYKGYEIQNLFNQDLSNLIDQDALIDSVQPTPSSRSYRSLLPAVFSISFIPGLQKSNSITGLAGASYQINANSKPIVYGGVSYKLNDRISSSLIGIVGGYGTINAGLQLRYNSSNVSAIISSNNLIGLATKNGYGKHLNFGVLCRF